MCVSFHSTTWNCSSNECCNTKCNINFKNRTMFMQSCSHKRSPPVSILSQFNPADLRTNLQIYFRTGGHWLKSWPMNEICLSHSMQLLLLYMSAVQHSLILVSLTHSVIQSVYQRRSPTAQFNVMVLSHTFPSNQITSQNCTAPSFFSRQS
jgi:hypothetical protein